MADLLFSIEMMDAKTLANNPKNYRRHPERQKKEIGKSLQEFGWLENVLYNARTEKLINGHARVEIAAAKGEQVPVRVINVDPKTERRILVSLQRTGELGLNDEAALAALLEEVAGESDELPPGWSGRELEAMLETLLEDDEEEVEEEEEEEDEAAEPLSVPPSSIRMVQLFLTVQSEPIFRNKVEALSEAWGIETMTDVVCRTVSEAFVRLDKETQQAYGDDPLDENASAERSGFFGGDEA